MSCRELAVQDLEILPRRHAVPRHFQWRCFSVLPCQLRSQASCVMAPLPLQHLSSLVSYTMPSRVYEHTRFDGCLFTEQRFQARTKVSNTTVTDVIFADDGCSGRSHIRGGPTEPRLTALTLHVLLSGLTSATLKTVVI